MTKKLKSIITREEGRMVFVKPKIIVEVGYQEIQKSPTYSSGYALRFPRFIRERTDEKLEPDTIDRLESLFKSQGRTG
jgi:DNA ligase-1